MAEAHNNGPTPEASAKADAKAGAIGVTIGDGSSADITVTPAVQAVVVLGDVPLVGVAVAGAASGASAAATGGNTPTAYTNAGSGAFALAIGGKTPTVQASACDCQDQTVQTTDVGGKKTAIAYIAAGQYSVAVADKFSARAFSNTYGTGTAFTADDVFAAAKTWAAAWASANQDSASAGAVAGAGARGETPIGYAIAASASRAGARITIDFVPQSGSSSSSQPERLQCVLKVKDWKKWNHLPVEVRRKALLCIWPTKWVKKTDSHPAAVAGDKYYPRNAEAIFTAQLVSVAL
jgi:YD repeat-containing protein